MFPHKVRQQMTGNQIKAQIDFRQSYTTICMMYSYSYNFESISNIDKSVYKSFARLPFGRGVYEFHFDIQIMMDDL